MKQPLLVLLVLVFQNRLVFGASDALDPSQLAFNLNTTVGAYERFGRRDPKWDAEAKKCFTNYSRLRSWTNNETGELVPTLWTNLTRAAELGCDDPLVRYLYLRFVSVATGNEAGSAFLGNASVLRSSGYPELRKFYATMWARKALTQSRRDQSEAPILLTAAASSLAKALEDSSMPLKEADQACEFLMTASWWAGPGRWESYQSLEPSLTNRWKATFPGLLTKGRAYLTYAWKARGTGFAETVSDPGWKLMGDRLNIAAAALEAAWGLDPHDARVCQEMMRVELGQHEGRDRMEKWFQRGMKIDPASHDLCYEKMEYLRPRWYGSAEAMLDFGRECTANTNWTHSVRLMLVDAHYMVSQEIQDDHQRAAYWRQPQVWADIRFTFERFFKEYPNEIGYRHNYAQNALWCWQSQEFLNQAKMFSYTNYEFFGGVERFNQSLKWAQAHRTAK